MIEKVRMVDSVRGQRSAVALVAKPAPLAGVVLKPVSLDEFGSINEIVPTRRL